MSFPFKVAWRFLFSNKFQTILIMLGIGIGVSVQFFIALLIDGLQIDLIDKTIGNAPHIIISSEAEDRIIKDFLEINQLIDKIVGNEKKSSTEIIENAAFFSKDGKNVSMFFRGVNFEQADKIYNFNENIVEGIIPRNVNEVLVGIDFATENNVKIGDEIELLSFDSGFLRNKGKVTGIFDLGISNLNKNWVISNLETGRSFFKIDEGINKIEIQIFDVFLADIFAEELIKEIEKFEGVNVQNWKEQNADLLSGLTGQSISSLIIQIFVIISVSLGIASVLIITVLQKSKQIGILKAMGIKNSQSSLIFLIQGILLGVGGAIIGVSFGLFLLWGFSNFAVNADGGSVVNVYFEMKYVIISSIIAIGSSTLSSIIPARRSAKLDPVEVIRNG